MARTDNWWPGRATRILGAGGPNWPERLKKPAGQRASAYVEGCTGSTEDVAMHRLYGGRGLPASHGLYTALSPELHSSQYSGHLPFATCTLWAVDTVEF